MSTTSPSREPQQNGETTVATKKSTAAPMGAAPVHPLDELRRRTDSAKGTEFEKLAEGYLREIFGATDIRPQVPDLGVDRIFEDASGRTHTVQMKCYAPDRAVSMRDMTQFVEASKGERPASLILLHTSRISANAMKVVRSHSITVVGYDDLIEVGCWTGSAPVLPVPLDPSSRYYTQEAIDAALREVERGQVILPTGSGKTLIQAEVAREHETTVVWVPSITLVRQSISEFRRQTPKVPMLAVVSSAEEDDHGLPIEHTTDAAHLASFRAANPRHVVFATYQSSGTVLAAGGRYGLAIYDEAHRTAGSHLVRSSRKPLFKRSLDVDADRYRFFTATPRIHSDRAKKTAADEGLLSYSMDDAAIYGERLYELPITELIDNGWLSPFEIVVALVTRADIMAQIERNGWTDLYDPSDFDSIRDLAASILALDAVEEFGLKRVLTFHTTVPKAARARRQLSDVAASLGRSAKVHVASAKGGRDEGIRMLRDTTSTDTHIVANARLFTEGVNAPALDGIVYYDSKSSQIDIVQSIGRALRVAPGKDRAIVVLPVFVDDAKNAEEALEQGRYKTIWEVRRALMDLGIVVQTEEALDSGGTRATPSKRSFTAKIRVPEGWDVVEAEKVIEAIIVRGTRFTGLPLGSPCPEVMDDTGKPCGKPVLAKQHVFRPHRPSEERRPDGPAVGAKDWTEEALRALG